MIDTDDGLGVNRHLSELCAAGGMTSREYAELAGVHISTVKRWARRKIGPQPHKIGPRLVRYDRASVLAYLRGGERSGAM
jgi:predicted DNA-binding transcriptional regulator AlpA